MTTLREAAEEFIAQERVAVTGVSRDTKQPANLIYRRLRDAGHEVFAVNPNAVRLEGDVSYAAVTDIPGGVDGVVVVEHGIAVIPGGCPNMFGATSDPGQRGMLRVLQGTGKLPRRIEDVPACSTCGP